MSDSTYKELHVNLDFLDKMSNEDPGSLKKKIYEAFSGLSFLAIEAKAAQFKRWASILKDRYNDSLFSAKDSRLLEEVAQIYLKPILEGTHDSTQDMRSNKTFREIDEYFKELDQMIKGVSRGLGSFRFFHERANDFKTSLAIPLQSGKTKTLKVPVGPMAAPVALGIVTEAIRIIYQVSPLTSETTKEINVFLLGLIDSLKGDWKQGAICIAEFFQRAPLYAKLIGKVILNILDFIAPDLQNFLEGCKSRDALFAFFLWGFVNFSPEIEKNIVRKCIDETSDSSEKVSEHFSLSENDIQSIKSSRASEDLQKIHIIKLLLE